ncbi:MAG: alpha-ribazole phosphatase [Anaerolineaceae bacterium]
MDDKPLTLLLVRHGQTVWNRMQRFQGQSDVPLDETGMSQIEKVASRLAHETLDVVYTSDLSRAQATARAIAGYHTCPVIIDPRLRELSFGEWEGLTYAEIASRFPERLTVWERDPFRNAPPGGETVAQLADRVGAVLRDLRSRHASQTVVIAAHGGPLQTLICLALDHLPEKHWQFSLRPGSLSEIAFYPAGAILNFLNETYNDR